MPGFIAAGFKQKNEGTRVGELTLGVATALQAFPLLVAKGEFNRTNGGHARVEGSAVSNNILTRCPQYKASVNLEANALTRWDRTAAHQFRDRHQSIFRSGVEQKRGQREG